MSIIIVPQSLLLNWIKFLFTGEIFCTVSVGDRVWTCKASVRNRVGTCKKSVGNRVGTCKESVGDRVGTW